MGDSVASLHADLGLETARFNAELAAAETKLIAAAASMQIPIKRINDLLSEVGDSKSIDSLSIQFYELQRAGLSANEALAAISQQEMSREKANAELQREIAAAQKKEIAEQLAIRKETTAVRVAQEKQADAIVAASRQEYTALWKSLLLQEEQAAAASAAEYVQVWKSALSARAEAQAIRAEQEMQAEAIIAAQHAEYAALWKRLLKEQEVAEAEAVAARLAAEKLITAEVGEQLATRAAMEMRARKASAEADAAIAAEKTAFNRTLTQAGYLGGGYTGGHAVSAVTSMSATTAGIIAGGLALAYATKLSVEFDKALTENTANMKGMADGMKEQLGKAALDISAQYGLAADKVAASFKGMQESGYDAAQSINLLPTFAKYAVAASAELTTSVEHLRAVQHAFGLESADATANQQSLAEISRVIIAANRNGGESADKYAKALAAVGPEAHNMGISIYEAAAAIGILGLQNVEGARSGEVLSRVIITIKNANEKHKQSWDDLGVKIYEVGTNKLLPLTDIMANLTKVVGTSDPALNTLNFNLLGITGRAEKFVTTFLRQNDAMREGTKATKGLNDIVQEVAGNKLDNFASQFHIMASGIKRDAIEATAPLVEMAKNVTMLINAYAAFQGNPLKPWSTPPAGFRLDSPKPGTRSTTLNYPPAGVTPAAGIDQAAAAAADTWATTHSKSLPVLRKELADVQKEIISLDRLLSSSLTPVPVRAGLETKLSEAEQQRDKLKRSIDDITGLAQSKADAEAARKYREEAQEITNWENHQKKLLEIKLKEEGTIQEVDEASINANRDRLLKYEKDVLAITEQANRERKDKAKSSKTEVRQDSQLTGATQDARDDAASKGLDIRARAESAKLALVMKESQEETRIRGQQQREEERFDDRVKQHAQTLTRERTNDIVKAEQDEVRSRAESSVRRLELDRQEYRQREQLGLISRKELIAQERRLDAEEYNTQRAALTAQIDLMREREGFDVTAASRKQALEAQLRNLLDQRAAKEQGYANQERIGLDSIAEATTHVLAEQRKLNDLAANGASRRIAELNELQIGTKLLEIRVRGAGGAYMEMTKSVEQALGGVGHTLAEGVMDPKNFTKTWKSALHSMETQILGDTFQAWIKLGAAQISTVVKHAAVEKTAAVLRKEAMAEQLIQIKAVAAAQIVADQSVMESKAAMLSELDASIIVAAKAVALAEVMDAAAVGGAWATSSTAAIPIYGPSLALEAGLAMQSAIQGAFGASLVATLSDGGDVPHDSMQLVHGGEHMLNRDITAELYKAIDSGGLGGGGGTHFDFSHANFSGSHVTESGIKRIMTNMLDQLRRAGGATHTKRGRL